MKQNRRRQLDGSHLTANAGPARCCGGKSAQDSSVDATTFRIYNWCMEFTWSETKRAANIKAHSLDFLDAESVFESVTFTFEDDRFSYGEQRFVTLGSPASLFQ